MIKINIIKWGIIALTAPLLIISCTDDFLDTKLTGAATEETYYSTMSGLSQLVTGTYAGINVCPAGLHNLDMMYIAYGSIASDEAEAGGEQGGNDIVDFQNWDQGNPQSAESKAVTDNNWGYNYKVIDRANQTLTGIAYYREKNSGMVADTAALLNRFEGEMKFLRAFSHFKLTQIYGGIIIVDHVLGSTEYSLPRNTVAECLHFVQQELLEAIDLLPEKDAYSASDMGRATKGAAEALLAKAYLYEASYAENYPGDARFAGCENTYSKALEYAEIVINTDKYSLVGIKGETFDTYWNQNGSTMYPTSTPGYRYIFTTAGENSGESIFEIQSINDGQNYMLSRGTYLTIYTTVRNYGAGTTLGWGFNCPTEDLLNAYEEGDPRKMVTIGENGDPVFIADAWSTLDCHQSPTNMIGRKYEGSPADYWSTRSSDGNGPVNFPYIRYADVVLMAAEAAFKTDDNGKALTYVNMVRKRARNGALTGVPADLLAITFDDIVNERLCELALEGHRFFDLVRWGKQEVMIGQELQKWLGGAAQESPVSNSFTIGVNEFFPIPLTEIINSNGGLVQYPGYE